jgi:hypothetical protein
MLPQVPKTLGVVCSAGEGLIRTNSAEYSYLTTRHDNHALWSILEDMIFQLLLFLGLSYKNSLLMMKSSPWKCSPQMVLRGQAAGPCGAPPYKK